MLPLQDQIEQMVLNVGLSALDCSEIFQCFGNALSAAPKPRSTGHIP
jgi:hypothetical protein